MKNYKAYIIGGITLLAGVFSIQGVSATDACNSFQPQSVVSKQATIKFGVNIRSFPCTTKSTVLGLAGSGKIYQITRKVDGYYEVKLENGNTGWIWDSAITVSSSNSTGYNFTQKDRDLIARAKTIIEKAVKKNYSIRGKLIRAINKALPKASSGSRIKALLKELLAITNATSSEEAILTGVSTSTPTESSGSSDINSNSTISYSVSKIDISKLRSSWNTWYNDYRSSLKLGKYTYDSRLQKTAEEWTELSKKRGNITHERTPGDGFYNYPIIEKWFQARGVKCKVSGRSTSVENTGYYSYSCNDSDCTDEATKALRYTFDYYLSEKSYNGSHYRSIVSPYLQYMGLGVSIINNGNGRYKMYNTTHFCTEFE